MDLTRYHRQVEAARNVGLSMTRTQARAFLQLLEQYAEELASRVASGYATRSQEQSLAIAREIIRQMVHDLAVSTGNGVRITANRAAEIYADATGTLLRAQDPGFLTGTLFPGLGTSSAQAVLTRPELSAAFVSVRRSSVSTVDQIIRRALLRGATSTRVAMELRLHIMGADALPPDLLLDRRRIGYDAIRAMGYEPTRENLLAVRKDAGRVADRAQLIARTEPMNAEWEAHMQAAADSPVVRAIQWELSSRHPHVDVCFRAGTLIATPSGNLPIESLAAGDMVLTHAGRARPVTRTYHNPAQRLLRLRYRVGNSHIREVVMTPNHPVLTHRGWIPAGDLRTGDRGCGLPLSPPQHRDRPVGDTSRTEGPSSGGSAIVQSEERASGLPHGEHLPVGSHKTRIRATCCRAPIDGPTPESESDQHLGHQGNLDSPHPDETPTTQCASRRASPIRRSKGRRRGLGSHRHDIPSIVTRRGTPENRNAGDRDTRWGRTGDHTLRTAAPQRRLHGVGGSTHSSRSAGLPRWTGACRIALHTPGTSVSPAVFVPLLRKPWSSSASLWSVAPLGSLTPSGGSPFRTTHSTSLPSYLSGIEAFRVSVGIYPLVEIIATEEVIPAPGELVYNLGVEGDHTYLAGGLVVHNCDLLAKGDWYGLGPGVYDPRMVPPRPHPRDLCRHRDVIAPVSEWGRARGPLPQRRLDVAEVVQVYELPPSQEAMLARALAVGESRTRRQAAA